MNSRTALSYTSPNNEIYAPDRRVNILFYLVGVSVVRVEKEELPVWG